MSYLQIFSAALFLLLLGIMSCQTAQHQAGSEARQLLERSMAYHDPESTWSTGEIELKVVEERPDTTTRYTNLTFNNPHDKFILQQRRGDVHIVRMVSADTCVHKINHSEQFSPETAAVYHVDCEYSRMLKDYYTFLWGLPMQAGNSGGILEPGIDTVQYLGESLLKIRLVYEEPEGNDTWDLYFSPSTSALSGYAFYHGSDTLSGEYIRLSGELAIGKIRYPAERSWYKTKDSTYLGKDLLVK